MKKILGLAAVMVLAMSQLSFSAKSDTDAAVQRLVRVAKQRQAKQAKDAAKGVAVEEEVVVVPVEETVTTSDTAVQDARERAEAARAQAQERAAKAREVAQQRKTKTRDIRAQRRNMSESKMMDVEIQRIRKRVDQINSNIEKFHKTNEMLDQMEQRLDAIQDRMN